MAATVSDITQETLDKFLDFVGKWVELDLVNGTTAAGACYVYAPHRNMIVLMTRPDNETRANFKLINFHAIRSVRNVERMSQWDGESADDFKRRKLPATLQADEKLPAPFTDNVSLDRKLNQRIKQESEKREKLFGNAENVPIGALETLEVLHRVYPTTHGQVEDDGTFVITVGDSIVVKGEPDWGAPSVTSVAGHDVEPKMMERIRRCIQQGCSPQATPVTACSPSDQM